MSSSGFTGLVLSLVLSCQVNASSDLATRKTLFVLLDGIPADVIERVETPNLDLISGEGGYTRAYVGGEVGGDSESPTVSAVSYQSLLTGTWANKHNVWNNRVSNPDYGYWGIFRIAKAHDPSLHTALFSTWEDNRTRLIGDGLDAAGGMKLDHYVDGMENDQKRFPIARDSGNIKNIDTFVASQAADYIAVHGPDLTWVYLQYTDDMGHRYGDSTELDAAVRFADDLMGDIWQSIQARQAKSGENWLVVVTTDHGRKEKDGKGHGGQSSRERTTWIVTNSTCRNDRYYKTPGIVDILPSIVEHMKITMPEKIRRHLDGASFLDCP
ncbi:MAG TPA: alkaline phosphatase family protein [Gammaproteobacteria bacterium]|nr:alkaline phosphatase family protein [Gammaproteobacteria bacterium]